MQELEQIETSEVQTASVPLHAAVAEDVSSAESVLEEYVERAILETEPHGRHVEDKPHGPLPIIIGVTGHRDIRDEDVEAIETELKKQLQHIRSRYPST